MPDRLLVCHCRNRTVRPRHLTLGTNRQTVTTSLVRLFRKRIKRARNSLGHRLRSLRNRSAGCQVQQKLTRLLQGRFTAFRRVDPLRPRRLQQQLFSLTTRTIPSPDTDSHRQTILNRRLDRRLSHRIAISRVHRNLCTSLPSGHVLARFRTPRPSTLLRHCGLSRARNIFCGTDSLIVRLCHGSPNRCGLVFHCLGLFQLVACVRNSTSRNFAVAVSNPTDLFGPDAHCKISVTGLVPTVLRIDH